MAQLDPFWNGLKWLALEATFQNYIGYSNTPNGMDAQKKQNNLSFMWIFKLHVVKLTCE